MGLTVIDKGYPNSGEGQWWNRVWSCEFAWSYPVGLESKIAKGYNDEIIAIAHSTGMHSK